MFKLIFFFISFSTLAFGDVKINSIIKLDEKKVPNECGLGFLLEENNLLFNAAISIKKLDNKDTLSIFKVESNGKIKSADLITATSKISKLLNKKEIGKSGLKFYGVTPQDSMTFFFQDLLINGGQIIIDEVLYEFQGPIDSKVRLEYLFCTGEMFLPNYNENE